MSLRRLVALLVLLLCASAGAHAQRDPDLFPLNVHIFERSLHKVRRFAAYRGEGKANLIELNQTNGFNFTYDCEYKFHSSEGEEFYPARWKKEGLSLEILMGVIGSDTRTHTCELKIMLRDEVYAR